MSIFVEHFAALIISAVLIFSLLPLSIRKGWIKKAVLWIRAPFLFRKIFGHKRTRFPQLKKSQQTVVDLKLRELAKDLDEAYRYETCFLEKIARGRIDFGGTEKVFRERRKTIKIARHNFYLARNVARQMEFKAKDSHKDYFPH